MHGQISLLGLFSFPKCLSSGNMVYHLVPKGPYWTYIPLTEIQVLSTPTPRVSYGPASFQWPSLPSLGRGSHLSYSAPIATSVYGRYSTYHFDTIICYPPLDGWCLEGVKQVQFIFETSAISWMPSTLYSSPPPNPVSFSMVSVACSQSWSQDIK